MTPECITARSLIEALEVHKALRWVAGAEGGQRCIGRSGDGTATSLVARLNLIHPVQVQVLGEDELAYLTSLRRNSRKDVIERLFDDGAAMVIVADDKAPPPSLVEQADLKNIPLLTSSLPAPELVDLIGYILSDRLAESAIVHGVFMEVMGIGVLLTGESSVGKSELALELLSRGHRLIADDAPEFARIAPDILRGSCPPILQDFLEVRGLGILNVRALYGDSAIKTTKYLKLIVHLAPFEGNAAIPDRLHGELHRRIILGLEIPAISLPVAPGRNLAVLVEAAVRNHLLRLKGYNAGEDLEARQQRMLERDASSTP